MRTSVDLDFFFEHGYICSGKKQIYKTYRRCELRFCQKIYIFVSFNTSSLILIYMAPLVVKSFPRARVVTINIYSFGRKIHSIMAYRTKFCIIYSRRLEEENMTRNYHIFLYEFS